MERRSDGEMRDEWEEVFYWRCSTGRLEYWKIGRLEDCITANH
jgi:hypothetical protein